MAVTERTHATFETYERIALEDPSRPLELHRGRLREKPGMTFGHNSVQFRLTRQLVLQLDPDDYEIRENAVRVRRGEATVYIPDVVVLPLTFSGPFIVDRPRALEVYTDPMPFVAEIWSPSTGDYDIDTKVPDYQRRGDAEIWRVHPFEREFRIWRRQPDGGYEESVRHGGTIRLLALPWVEIDLDALFYRPKPRQDPSTGPNS